MFKSPVKKVGSNIYIPLFFKNLVIYGLSTASDEGLVEVRGHGGAVGVHGDPQLVQT